LATLRGSGPQGRILKADIDAALGIKPVAPPLTPTDAVSPPRAAPTNGEPSFREVPHTRMRKVIAQRLGEAKRTIPHFYLRVSCRVDALQALRADLNARNPGTKLTLNDFVVRAAALALRQVPAAHASWTDEAMRLYHRVDVAVAVATETGLITPIV